jgi:signal transduction histidine kinase
VRDLVSALEWLNLVSFVGLSLLAVRLWTLRRARGPFWAMLAFAALAVIVIVGRVAPSNPSGFVEVALQRVEIAILLVFPYLLYRFTTAFDPPTRRVTLFCDAMTTAMVTWTFALPHFPHEGEPHGAGYLAFLAGFLVHWTLLSAISAERLWAAGRGQPSVARTRMRLLSGAAGLLTVAIFLVVSAGETHLALRAVTQLLAFVSAVAFALGLAPPRLLRMAWRTPESRRLQDAIGSLMTQATSREQIVDRVLGPMADIVGARSVELRDGDGRVLGTHRAQAGDGGRVEVIEVEAPGGSLRVETTPYAPFFGDEELALLRTLAAMTGVALDRVRLFVQERETRLALERANETMANFVALAAHELRTPITSIHGFVHTLNHLGDRLSDEQKREVSATLEQQTVRMARLVEQLLDLSRLDADAVEIAPQRFLVRERIDELVEAAAAEHADAIVIDVGEELEAEADLHAFDRIVTNLITNAFRYGDPPVVVRAERRLGGFRVVVEDRGSGVPSDFVPDLFERFTRSDRARARASGTGLGLAIARSYARAHGGDLLYSAARPQGARFELFLPAATSRAPSGLVPALRPGRTRRPRLAPPRRIVRTTRPRNARPTKGLCRWR